MAKSGELKVNVFAPNLFGKIKKCANCGVMPAMKKSEILSSVLEDDGETG